MQTIAGSLFPDPPLFDAGSMDQVSTRNQEFKPKVDDLSTYSAHLVAFATETLPLTLKQTWMLVLLMGFLSRSRIMLNTAKGVGPRALVLVDEVAA